MVFEGGDVFQLYVYLGSSNLDILLLDINLPNLSGFDVLKTLGKKYPNVKVLILSSYQDVESVNRAYNLGASGYLTKSSAAAEILLAIEKVKLGETYVSQSYREKLDEDANTSASGELSERETQILRLICKENTSQEIAESLGLSINTINNHRKSLLKKVGTDNLVGLFKYAFHKGYLD